MFFHLVFDTLLEVLSLKSSRGKVVLKLLIVFVVCHALCQRDDAYVS